MGVVLRIQSNGVRAATINGEYGEAVTLGESILAQAGVVSDLKNGTTHGRSPGGLVWQVTVDDYQAVENVQFSSTVPLKSVRVQVAWKRNDESRLFDLWTLKPASLR